MKLSAPAYLLLSIAIACSVASYCQPVTGVWRGRVTKGNGLLKQTFKLEVKLVKNGDSITGTSYYYASANNYFRYSVKGYFGVHDNSINWWDDQLLESHSLNLKMGSINNQPLLSVADYNCPGRGVMLLDGNTHPKDGGYQYDLHLQKMEHPEFRDEWDPIIETYFTGGADPYLIDSVGKIAFAKSSIVPATPIPTATPPVETGVFKPLEKKQDPVTIKPSTEKEPEKIAKQEPELVENPWKQDTVKKPVPELVKEMTPAEPTNTIAKKESEPAVVPPTTSPVVKPTVPTVEEKFTRRKIVLNTTIPVVGDTLVFKFYDNAEVDGDSISIFLNGKMLYTHVRLTDKGYAIKIPVANLQATDNELVMVAENLGSIPPNTAYTEAWSGGKRYTARMESTEGSSAMISLKKE